MRRDRRVAVVIPARDEAECLAAVLDRVPAFVDQVVVADNGSTDDTEGVARDGGAQVVREEKIGYGAACQAGLAVLDGRWESADVVVFLDADGSDDPREMARLVDPLLDDAADLVIGVRTGTEAMPWHQRTGTALLASLLGLCFGTRATDLGPYRAIRWGTLRALQMRDDGFAWTAEMQARALRQRQRVLERPVRWRPGGGRSSISGTLRGSLRAGRDLTRAILVQAVASRWDRVVPLLKAPRRRAPPPRPQPSARKGRRGRGRRLPRPRRPRAPPRALRRRAQRVEAGELARLGVANHHVEAGAVHDRFLRVVEHPERDHVERDAAQLPQAADRPRGAQPRDVLLEHEARAGEALRVEPGQIGPRERRREIGVERAHHRALEQREVGHERTRQGRGLVARPPGGSTPRGPMALRWGVHWRTTDSSRSVWVRSLPARLAAPPLGLGQSPGAVTSRRDRAYSDETHAPGVRA